jgi:2-(1,2-epoxy-1,2-dihydrophenyl)acetyl-CoA isomerase
MPFPRRGLGMSAHECPRHEGDGGADGGHDEDIVGSSGSEFPIGVESHALIIVVGVSSSSDPAKNYDTILVERANGVVTITFNRPKSKNSVNGVMWAELIEVLNEIQHNGEDRVVVFTGAGNEFCSGADLSSIGSREGQTKARQHGHYYYSMREVSAAILAIHRLPQPTIAKVRGVAVGVGCNIAFGCDLVVASDNARFSEIFSKRGLSLDGGGSWILPRRVGMHKAKELAFFADILSAEEADRFGLLNRVVPDAQLDAFVAEWCERLLALPPIALAQSKRMLNNAMQVTMEEALDDEGIAQSVNFSTKDTAEAISAWMQKRTPTFKGR